MLTALIEVSGREELSGEPITDVYEVYSGDWVQVYGLSANAYWHPFQYWFDNMREYNVVDRRSIQVLRDGAYVGHWNTIEEVTYFLTYYLRRTIIDVVSA